MNGTHDPRTERQATAVDGREPLPAPLPNSITTARDTRSLTPAELQDRAIIHRGHAATAEVDAFRELRTRLLAASSGNFVTLVAPVSAGSGGSFVARNLAAAFAFDESRSALLVDCDLRHPSQHLTMRVACDRGGLIDHLDDAAVEMADIVYETGAPRLRLLPAGRMREASGEYFSGYRMRLLLDSLRSQHPNRYIVLDSPPALGTPDARILSDLADIVVLVAGYGRDTPATIAQAAAAFEPRKFAGVVFNEGV